MQNHCPDFKFYKVVENPKFLEFWFLTKSPKANSPNFLLKYYQVTKKSKIFTYQRKFKNWQITPHPNLDVTNDERWLTSGWSRPPDLSILSLCTPTPNTSVTGVYKHLGKESTDTGGRITWWWGGKWRVVHLRASGSLLRCIPHSIP